MTISVHRLHSSELASALEDLARLRCEVFAAFPYLYDGDLAYEREYLREFAAEPGSVLVVASDAGRIVGAATASPMAAQKAEFRAPFQARGFDTARLFYFGESVLLPQYRGAGIGHTFFDHREASARDGGATHATFAAVIRPVDHPARPADYRPLDQFWSKRGYAPVEGLVTEFAWQEHGLSKKTSKPMQYWMREL